jgi:translation initiation factor IF-3
MLLAEAREIARKSNLDLVEVAPTADPPVCRLLDYGKYKYEQAKRERGDRRSQKISLLREVRLRPKIGDHDFNAKARIGRKLLLGGDKLKVTIMFRGREVTHPELGWKLLQRMAKELEDVSSLERRPVMEGRRMNVILTPASIQKGKAKEPQYAKAEDT